MGMDFVIFFLCLASAMVLTILLLNHAMRKHDVNQMRDLVSGKAIAQSGPVSPRCWSNPTSPPAASASRA